jgi:hypothetical protein
MVAPAESTAWYRYAQAGIAQIPAHTQNDHYVLEVSSLKHLRPLFVHPSPYQIALCRLQQNRFWFCNGDRDAEPTLVAQNTPAPLIAEDVHRRATAKLAAFAGPRSGMEAL